MENIEMSKDVLIEILVLLPPKTIFSFMRVSRRWRTILRDPLFLRSYSAAAPLRLRRSGGGRLLAFFQRLTNPKPMEPGKHCNTLAIPLPESNNIIEEIPRKFGYFINSSNGLILCSHEDRRRIYHVLNPVTRVYVSLPPPPNHYLPISTGIMCGENTTDLVPIYTIIRTGLPLSSHSAKFLHIDTYSSITGEWSKPRSLAATDRFLHLMRRPPVVANGVFHWYSSGGSIAVYDPNDGDDRLQMIRLPFPEWSDSYAITRSADDDLLWYGVTSQLRFGVSYRWRIQFYMLPKGENGSYKRETSINSEEWVLIYDISVDSLYRDMKILNASEIIVLESMIVSPWRNSQIVALLRHGREVFLYNLESRSVERVECFGRYSECDDNYLCPYIESSFLSSYAL